MEAAWNALGDADKLTFNYVVIQVGHNDVVQDDRSYSDIVGWYEDLLEDIHDDINPFCKVIMFTMTPFKQDSIYWTTARQTKQTALNAWILANETNVDVTSNANRADLLGDPDTIDPAYQGNGSHPNTDGYMLLKQNIIDEIQLLE